MKDRYPSEVESATQAYGPEKLFDITCTVGSVYVGGILSPRVVAFQLIAEHGADGEYSFPNQDGTTTMVAVATVNASK